MRLAMDCPVSIQVNCVMEDVTRHDWMQTGLANRSAAGSIPVGAFGSKWQTGQRYSAESIRTMTENESERGRELRPSYSRFPVCSQRGFVATPVIAAVLS